MLLLRINVFIQAYSSYCVQNWKIVEIYLWNLAIGCVTPVSILTAAGTLENANLWPDRYSKQIF